MARKKSVPGDPRVTPAKTRNAIAVARVVAPVVLPVVTPYIVQTAAAVRDRIDRRRARRLGVAVDDLAQYSGRGGALHARIVGAADGLKDLRDRPDVPAEDAAFATESESTLRQLAAAVRAAERMPAARRRAVHRAVVTELDRVEQRLLRAFGV